MKIRFHGAVNGHVTGSCTEFFYGRTNTRFLVDCGIVQGEGQTQSLNDGDFPFDPKTISAVILTHAHQDHCGLLPVLYKQGFAGKVICTSATADITRIMLCDASGHQDALYGRCDVDLVQFYEVDKDPEFGLSRPISIEGLVDLRFTFMRNSHMLGSVSVGVEWIFGEKWLMQIVMSGDLGPNTKANPYQSLHAGRQGVFAYPDVIVLESTYGNRRRESHHANRDSRLKMLAAVVKDALADRSGPLVIPCFSLQRTPDILFDLYCLYGLEGAKTPVAHPLMSDQAFEKMVAGGPITANIYYTLKWLVEKYGSQEDATILADFSRSLSGLTRCTYILQSPSADTVERLRRFATTMRLCSPLTVYVESTLACKLMKVYRHYLNQRQKIKPDEPIYRNRMLPEWFDVQTESEVDAIIDKLFGGCTESHGRISGAANLGGLRIRFGERFKMPDSQVHEPTIVISSGGMCEGGPVVKQLPEYLVRESVTFMATGYMSENSTGAAIVAMLKQAPEHRRGTLRFSIRDRPGTEKRVVEVDAADVRATLADMSGYYSGHADVEGLCDFSLSVLNPRGANLKPQPVRILLNHGNDSARRALVDEIKSRSGKSGLRCVASVDMAVGGRWYDLEKHMRVCKRSPTAKQPSVAQKQSGCLVTQKSRRFTDNPARKNVPIIVSTFNLKRAVEFSSC